MASWIYVFSKFTDEALLFEAMGICLLCASYAAFWILKKRKYGVLGKQGSTNIVKGVLTELIIDAEQLRAQLFGLLAGNEIPMVSVTAMRASGQVGASTAILPLTSADGTPPGMAVFEAKINEQARAMESILADKARLETELAQARGGKPGEGGGAGNDKALQDKIAQLEAKLAEYSVIEDDLANLKRLQQENAALKAQLAGKGIAPAQAAGPVAAPVSISEVSKPSAAAPTAGIAEVASPIAESPSPAEVAQAAGVAEAMSALAEPAAAPVAEASPLDAMVAEPIAESAPTDGLAATPIAEVAQPTADPNFEGLVDQVEQSLKPEAGATETPAVAAAAPATPVADTASPAAKPANSPERSDADLVAEFEKMLNS